jgi:hypothetical protein
MSGWDQAGDIDDLARQLEREHYEGMAADRLEAERKSFAWDVEGWDGDTLLLYIAGSGLHRIPADEVVWLANAMLAEHQLHFTEEVECDHSSIRISGTAEHWAHVCMKCQQIVAHWQWEES